MCYLGIYEHTYLPYDCLNVCSNVRGIIKVSHGLCIATCTQRAKLIDAIENRVYFTDKMI